MRSGPLLVALTGALVVGSEGAGRGAPAPAATVEAKVDRPIAGLGEVLTYSITVRVPFEASSYSHAPGKLDGVDLLSVTPHPTTSLEITQGVMRRSLVLTVAYRLRAKKLGKFELGPGKLTLDDKAYPMPKVSLEIVPPGKAPPPVKRPLDPFDDLLKLGDDDDEPPPPKDDVTDPAARLDEVPAAVGASPMFLRTVLDDPRPVIGQPVLAKLFVYSRAAARFVPTKPMSFPDFANFRLKSVDDKWRNITLGGAIWQWKLWESCAVFPLHGGTLVVPPAEVEATRIDAFTVGGPITLQSAAVSVEAVEPRLEGRPAGYVIGDVAADLAVFADVQPREIKDGHALLELKLHGQGRVERLSLTPPAVANVTWTKTLDESKTMVDTTTVRGGRRVLFDARFDRVGEIELGVLRVPVWDHLRRDYFVAEAKLGVVRVGVAAPATSASTLPMIALPAPREELGGPGHAPRLAGRSWPFIVSLGGPSLVLVLGALSRAASSALRRRQVDGARPDLRARRALEALGDDADDAARVLDLALEARIGRPPRGLTRKELAAALEAAGEGAHAREILALHQAIADARFAKEAAPGRDTVRAVAAAILGRIVGEPRP